MTWCLEGEHAASEFPGVQVVDGLLDVLHRIGAGDQLVELQTACLVQVDDHRDVGAGPGRAVPAAHDRLVHVHPGHEERGLGRCRWHTEDAPAAAPTQAVDGVADDGRMADALEGEVDPVGDDGFYG